MPERCIPIVRDEILSHRYEAFAMRLLIRVASRLEVELRYADDLACV